MLLMANDARKRRAHANSTDQSTTVSPGMINRGGGTEYILRPLALAAASGQIRRMATPRRRTKPALDAERVPHIALLRGVNVGGNRLVPMADLRAFLAALGCGDPRSLLQSGNLVFTAAARPRGELERWLETEAERRLDLRTGFFVRTALEWRAIVSRNPFPDEATGDPGHLQVMCLKDAPTKAAVEALRARITGRERIHADGTQLYAVYPDGVGTSRLTTALIDSALGTPAT
jgi:uncharacterized protein (DUF1697 family)